MKFIIFNENQRLGMKRAIFFLFLMACNNVNNNIDYQPKYKDFINHWESENLIGKVKKLEQYKAHVIDIGSEKTDKPIVEFKKEFTKLGNISYLEYFDGFGKLEQYIKNEFDKNGYQIKSVSENFIMPSKYIEKTKVDTLTGKKLSVHAIFNDTTIFDLFFDYDSSGNLIKQTNIENGDTILGQFEYKYDSDGRILSSKRIINNNSDETVKESKYNPEGNLLEVISKTKFFEVKLIYEYDKQNRIKKITEYKSGEIDNERFFDEHYNETMVRFYVKNSLSKEMKNEYKFDEIGNWIYRDVTMKEYSGSKKAILVYTESRNIEYYQ